jgi:hypothetical protein
VDVLLKAEVEVEACVGCGLDVETRYLWICEKSAW